jgi:hypothetical protein
MENLINALLRGEAQNARLGAIADEHLHARVRVDIWRVRSPDWMAERRQRRSGVELIRGASRSDLPESNPDSSRRGPPRDAASRRRALDRSASKGHIHADENDLNSG